MKACSATHCNTLQHAATHGNALPHAAAHTTDHLALSRACEMGSCTLQHTATHCNSLQHAATHCPMLCTNYTSLYSISRVPDGQLHTATHCNTLQNTATHCNTLQHTATYCNILQRTAAQSRECALFLSFSHARPHSFLAQRGVRGGGGETPANCDNILYSCVRAHVCVCMCVCVCVCVLVCV